MTKLAIMSDLHIDLNHFGRFEIESLRELLIEEQVEHLHLAGDIANDFQETSLPFIRELQKYLTVTYNLGNHDMLHLKEKEIEQLDFQLYDLGQKQLLAFHGWYDYSFSDDESLEAIVKRKKMFWFDRRLERPFDDQTLTEQILKKLETSLQALDGKNAIVAMHFVPHRRFIMTHERFKPFNSFLGSQAFHEVFQRYGASDVVFGHAHRRFGRVVLDGVTYHSHPLGYKREWQLSIDFVQKHPEYNPTNTWHLAKRYNAIKDLASFKAHYKQHFKEELRQAMTVFEV